MVKTWMARRTAAEEKMRGGEGGYDTESKNKRRWGGVRYRIKKQKEVGERIPHDKKC